MNLVFTIMILCYRDDKVLMVSADFKANSDSIGYPEKLMSVFLVSPELNIVVRYPPYDWNSFGFNPYTENKIVAVLPDNKIAVFPDAQFINLDIYRMKPD